VIINTHTSTIADLQKADIETAQQSAVPLIAIMERVNATQAFDALQAGMAGVFCIEDNSELLLAAIRLVLAGGRFLPTAERGGSSGAD
jgi:DNA-binding NarL/FixJ family response regulator